MSFSVFNLISIIVFSIILILGVFIILQNKKSRVNWSFGTLALSCAIWVLTNFIVDVSQTREQALFWTKMTLVGPALFVGVFVYFTILFKNEKQKLRLYQKVLIFLPTLIFWLLTNTRLNIKDVILTAEIPPQPVLGPLYYFFTIYLFGFIGIGIYNLIKKYKESSKTGKFQVIYILIGTLLTVGWGIILSIALPFLNKPEFASFGPLGVILFFVFTALAITKYHLFEVKVILTEILVGIMGIVLLVLPFFMETLRLRVLTIGIFLLFCIFGYLLVRATHKEVKGREEAEKIAIQEKALRKKAEELAKEFKRLDAAKDQFIMATQHHLRTPLTSMQGYLDLIIEGYYGRVPKKIKEMLERFKNSTRNEIKIVNELLDISQFQLGKEVVFLRPNIKIEPILNEIIEELKLEAESKGIYLKLEKPAEKVPEIKADPSKLKVALTNIIDNGIKYTKQGGVTVKFQMSNDKLQIIVKDTGMGIPKEEFPFLLTKTFERGELAKKTWGPGKGIGLYLTANIIKAHNGKIWAESEGKDKGSTFYVELPINPVRG